MSIDGVPRVMEQQVALEHDKIIRKKNLQQHHL